MPGFLSEIRRVAGSRRANLVIIGCSALTTLLNMGFPLMYMAIFNRFIPTQDSDLLHKTMWAGFAAALFTSVYYFLMEHTALGLRLALSGGFRARRTAEIFDYRLDFFRKHPIGDIVQRLIPETDTLGSSLSRICCCTGSLVEIMIVAIILGGWNRPVLAVYAGTGALFWLWITSLKRAILGRKSAASSLSGKGYDLLFNMLGGIKQIKAGNLEAVQIASLVGQLSATRVASARVAVLDCALSAIPNYLFRLAFLTGLAVSFVSLRSGGISPVVFVVSLTLLYKMGRPFEELAAHAGMLHSGFSAYRRLGLFRPAHSERSGPVPFRELETGLEFRSVGFAYEAGKPVLKDVNLSVKRGDDIAIVGESGSGKSSLIHLLLRLAEPTQGNIRIDGRGISEYDLDSLRSKIGVVSQEVFLFNDTLRRNIDCRGVLPDSRLIEICRMCQLSGLVAKTPLGLDARVGERGALLSGGERQRVAIARLMARDAEILIFDEASSALDPQMEKAIREMLLAYRRERPSVTTITISHRPGAIVDAGKVHVMKNGSLVESGSAGELLHMRAHFSSLFTATGNPDFKTLA